MRFVIEHSSCPKCTNPTHDATDQHQNRIVGFHSACCENQYWWPTGRTQCSHVRMSQCVIIWIRNELLLRFITPGNAWFVFALAGYEIRFYSHFSQSHFRKKAAADKMCISFAMQLSQEWVGANVNGKLSSSDDWMSGDGSDNGEGGGGMRHSAWSTMPNSWCNNHNGSYLKIRWQLPDASPFSFFFSNQNGVKSRVWRLFDGSESGEVG